MIRFLGRIFAFLLLAYGLGLAWFAVSLPRPADEGRSEAIVVLTGGSGRIERGLDLLRREVAPRMFVSGVARTVRPAEFAEAYEVEPELMDCCVVLGRESFDTRSNGDEVARWTQRRRIDTIRLVTNDLHMPRARYELEKRSKGRLKIIVDAVPTDPSLSSIFLEYNKYLLGRAADLIGI